MASNLVNLEIACQQIFGISSRRYRQLAKEHGAPPVLDGKVDIIKACKFLIDYYRKLAEGQGSLSLTEERARLTKVNADLKQLMLRKKQGELIEKVWKITFVAYKEDEICLMPRKKARLKSMSDHNVRITEARRRSIISIKQIESVPVKCLAVDSEDKTFLVGKHLIPTHNTEMLLNIAGYHIDKDPCSILVIQPTLEMAKAWSKERLAPMLRDSPCFRGKVHDVKTRNPEETILLKNFPGGFIAIAGANSPASLAARPIRLLLCDEVDRYPISAGVEGDPVDLARGHKKKNYKGKWCCLECMKLHAKAKRRGESLPSVGRQPYKTHGMHQKLSQLNLINNKHIPEEYLTASIEQRKALLQGIFDTDGYVSKNGIAEITFSSKRLAYDVVELLRTLGIKPFIKEKKIVYNGADRKVWKITFVAYKEDEICLMPRKKARLKSMSDHNVRITEARRRSIISIKQIESVPVKCLAVDSEDKTFLVGKHLIPTHNTEMLLNIAGYHIDKDPCSILVIQPTLEMAKAWSKERLAPMLRDSPCFRGKVHDVKTRNPEETILLKNFPGGFIAIAGANSPASLAARPIRLLLCDEVDRYPISAGVEGDPVDLARKRTTTFWNRKIGLFSTPTIKGASRIELAYELSDKRKFYVPCLKCGFEQVLDFSNLKWEENNPETARYVCPQCGTKINDADKIKMLKRGRWIPERETGKIAGFWLNELYSPWVSFSNLVQRYIEAKKSKETMKVFINTSLGLPYEEEGEQIEESKLEAKREEYDIVPAGAGVLTCAVDVQEDRLECLVVGWGKDEEAWHIEHKILHGYTSTEEVWQQLDAYHQKTFKHESGALLKIAICVIDAGYMTKKVYDFVKPRQSRRVYAIKGSQTSGSPLVGRPRVVGKQKVKLFMVGSSTAKDIIFSRLKLEKAGAGYMHFNLQCDEEYFRQLTAEKAVFRLVKGFAVKEYIKVRPRNEILDLWVYSLAAHAILNPNIDKILKELAQNQSKLAQNEVKSVQNQSKMVKNESKLIENKPKPHFRRFRTSSWVKGW